MASRLAVSSDIHWVSLEEFARRVGSEVDLRDPKRSQGLATDEARSRLRCDGPNSLSPPTQQPEWVKFLLHFTNTFMIMLNAAGVLSVVAWAFDRSIMLNLWLGIVLFVVVRHPRPVCPVTRTRALENDACFLSPGARWDTSQSKRCLGEGTDGERRECCGRSEERGPAAGVSRGAFPLRSRTG